MGVKNAGLLFSKKSKSTDFHDSMDNNQDETWIIIDLDDEDSFIEENN